MFSKYYTRNGDNIKFEFSSIDELERFSRTFYAAERPRRIAGSKRVERYQREHGCDQGSGQGLLLQSITAQPALSSRSFEELRVECYAQSLVAQGRSPASVDAVATPEAVIPPLFNAYLDENDDILPNEINMTD